MGQEEQIEEREILASIFPDEITDISENSYRVAITLDVPGEEDDETEPPTILLTVLLPPTYPSTPPTLTLSTVPNAPKHPLFDLATARPHLLSLLPPLIADNLHTAMMFTLISALKEGAEALVAATLGAHEEELGRERRRREEEEERKFEGEKVTKESFARWKRAFGEEIVGGGGGLEGEREREREREGEAERRVTGREMWEKGLVGRGGGGEDEADE